MIRQRVKGRVSKKEEKTNKQVFISQNSCIFAVDMKQSKVYVASRWLNEYYPEVVEKLREAGYDV